MVTVPVLCISFAAKLRTMFSLNVKSAVAAGESAATNTVTSNGDSDPCSTIAVTVLAPPSSEIELGVSISDTVGAESVRHTSTVSPTRYLKVPSYIEVGRSCRSSSLICAVLHLKDSPNVCVE